jgi:thioredoxin 1
MAQHLARSPLVQPLTDASFGEAVMGADGLVVVELFTEWCPPCKALAPIIQSLAEELSGEVRFFTVDAEAELELARRYEVMAYPTLLAFRDGVLVARLVGARGKRHLAEELHTLLQDA